MNTEQTAVFIAWCIEEYAVNYDKTPQQTANLFNKKVFLFFYKKMRIFYIRREKIIY